MPFCPPFHSTAPSCVPGVTPGMGMERGKVYCCLHRAVIPSTKLSRFSTVPQLVVPEAAGLSLSRCDIAGSDPGCVQVPVPGRVLATALATQLPYKPWNVAASPVPLALGQLARGCLSKDSSARAIECCLGTCPWHSRARHTCPRGHRCHSIPARSMGPEGTV